MLSGSLGSSVISPTFSNAKAHRPRLDAEAIGPLLERTY
jgi:hypothetical protein